MSESGVFGTIFDSHKRSSYSSMQHQKGVDEDGVIIPPSMRTHKKKSKSKYYTRPVFKEPGSKMKDGQQEDQAEEQHISAPSRTRTGLIHGLRDEVGKILSSDTSGTSAIQPMSRTQDRLKSILGASSDHEMIIGRRRNWLTRNIPSQDHWYAETESTMDEDRILLSRRLFSGYEAEREPSDLSSLRREVNEIAQKVIAPSKQFSFSTHLNPSSTSEGESRDEVSEIQSAQEASSRGGASENEKIDLKGRESTDDSQVDWTERAICSCGWF